jgi:ketosteroid isomerase-like protein
MSNLEIVLAALKAWENRDIAAAEALTADDMTVLGPAPQPLPKAAYLTFQQVHNDAFGDWKFNVTNAREEGDTVYVNFQITATHTGPFDVSKLGIPLAPLPASGKHRAWPPESLTATVRDGKITQLHIMTAKGGGVIGTLEWLGAPVPAMA